MLWEVRGSGLIFQGFRAEAMEAAIYSFFSPALTFERPWQVSRLFWVVLCSLGYILVMAVRVAGEE